MAIILDADVIIRGERGVFDLAAWAASQPNERFEIAAITVAELWHGVERGANPTSPSVENILRLLWLPVPVIPYTEQTAYGHARLWADLQSAGKMIGAYDLIVVATALERGSRLATFNKRHFGMIKGLQVVEPK